MSTEFSVAASESNCGRSDGSEAASTAFERLDADRVDFCQVFCSSEYRPDAVIDGVRSVVGTDATLIGCSSMTEFTHERVLETGVAVSLVTSDTISFEASIGTGLSEDPIGAVREAMRGISSNTEEFSYRSAIVLHDGLASVGERLTLDMQRRLGPNVSFVGGAASDNFEMEATPVFCDDRVVTDGIVIAVLDSEQCPLISIGHGHEPISGPVEVTDADGCVVNELDGRPAYDVWKDEVREPVRTEFGVEIDDQEPKTPLVRRLLGEFEFGIDQGDGYKLRSPGIGSVEAGSLTFPVDVPEGTVFRVTHGGPDDQIKSARSTARRAADLASETPIAGALVYDCACRGTVLGDEFSDAVDAIDTELDLPFAGFETYGEVCMETGKLSGFHNTTTVILLLPE